MAWKWVNAKLILRKSGFVSQSAIIFSCFSHQFNRTVAFISRRVWYIDLVGNKAKDRILKRVFQENKAREIFRKRNISYLLILTYVCVSGGKKYVLGVRNVRFSEDLACFLFLKHPFWDLFFPSDFWTRLENEMELDSCAVSFP